nr:3-dehydroquinate synthase [Sedimentibacter sp.]
MTILNMNLQAKKYDILIEKGIFKNIGFEIKKIYCGVRIAVITDKNIYTLYGVTMNSSLVNYGFKPNFIVVEPGEKSKSMKMLEHIYTRLIESKITRGDMIIALGGGVIGDLGGFAASTYLRGVDYVQIPTSLLAQIDSSIGGKVAVNLAQGKNLIGSFYHPKKVLIDPSLINSLSSEFIRDGLGEVIKYACIKNSDFYELLDSIKSRDELLNKIEEIVVTCCNIKKEIVEQDERDTGIRMILNFGHTIGHVIEKYYNYEVYTHGEAVAIGMYYITQKSEALGYTELGTSEKIKKLLLNFNIEYSFPDIDIGHVSRLVTLDKKNISGTINLILLKKIGEAFIDQIPIKNIDNFLQ